MHLARPNQSILLNAPSVPLLTRVTKVAPVNSIGKSLRYGSLSSLDIRDSPFHGAFAHEVSHTRGCLQLGSVQGERSDSANEQLR